MSLLADAIQPFFVRELTSVGGRLGFLTLPDTLIAPMAAYDLSFDDSSESFIADFRDSTPVVTALAADACRLACASFQTISLATNEIVARDSLAWGFIKLYYSAFYAGNAIVRILGESCSYFDGQHALRINQTAAALGVAPGFNVGSGLYRCEIIEGRTGFQCTRIRGGHGGTHESFWSLFSGKMQVVSQGILRGPLTASDAQSAFNQIEHLRGILRRSNGHGWLSTIRNGVQYRQEHAVWYPRNLRAREREMLSRRAGRWTDDPMHFTFEANTTLVEFVTCCCFIVSLCQALLLRIAERSTLGARSFIRQGPLAYLNDIARQAQPES